MSGPWGSPCGGCLGAARKAWELRVSGHVDSLHRVCQRVLSARVDTGYGSELRRCRAHVNASHKAGAEVRGQRLSGAGESARAGPGLKRRRGFSDRAWGWRSSAQSFCSFGAFAFVFCGAGGCRREGRKWDAEEERGRWKATGGLWRGGYGVRRTALRCGVRGVGEGQGSIRRGGEGEKREFWDPKFCVPKMA